MNDKRIIDFVNGLFAEVKQTDKVIEQKEELQAHLTERIKDYMNKGVNFDEAFDRARNDIGDVNELTSGFEKKESIKKSKKSNIFDRLEETFERLDEELEELDEELEALDEEWEEEADSNINWMLIALSPFIFLALGFMFGWWAWAWMIIPVFAIVFGAPMDVRFKLIALSPFIFIATGFMFGWWAWGWMIIPVSGIVFGTTCHGKKRRKPKADATKLTEPENQKLQ